MSTNRGSKWISLACFVYHTLAAQNVMSQDGLTISKRAATFDAPGSSVCLTVGGSYCCLCTDDKKSLLQYSITVIAVLNTECVISPLFKEFSLVFLKQQKQ